MGTNNSCNTYIIAPTTHAVSMPQQSSFYVVSSDHPANVTGDGTNYTVTYENELKDYNNDFAASVYTAPVTGYYLFNVFQLFRYINLNNSLYIQIITSNRTYFLGQSNLSSLDDGATQGFYFSDTWAILTDMDAGDTAIIKIQIGGNAVKNVQIFGTIYCSFSGSLIG